MAKVKAICFAWTGGSCSTSRESGLRHTSRASLQGVGMYCLCETSGIRILHEVHENPTANLFARCGVRFRCLGSNFDVCGRTLMRGVRFRSLGSDFEVRGRNSVFGVGFRGLGVDFRGFGSNFGEVEVSRVSDDGLIYVRDSITPPNSGRLPAPPSPATIVCA